MREMRSRSQILFGFLPEQTVDLAGRVWKVKEWQDSIRKAFDDASLRQALRLQAAPWAAKGTDGSFVNDLIRGFTLEVRGLDKDAGVRVEPFPRLWVCNRCQVLSTTDQSACPSCKGKKWGQFHFVGYHECGTLRSPFVPKCPEHKLVRVIFPGTASAAEIKFVCPVCHKQIRKGLGMPNCDCGNGRMQFTVHRAASVYTPRGIVVVNPPSPERVQELTQAGGPARALEWILDGAETESFKDLPMTPESLEQQLIAGGLSPQLAKTMAQQAVSAGEVQSAPNSGVATLPSENLEAAHREAVTIAMALSESRIRIKHLISRTTRDSPLGSTYRGTYQKALGRARLEDVELLDKLPILTGNFGYTRGDATPGATRLIPFRNRNGNYVVYADIAKTEAMFVRLDPVRVAGWLRVRGFPVPETRDARTARLAILELAHVPAPGEDVVSPTCGSELLGLIHSFSHRFMRQAALFSGVERNSLAELLLPLHMAFFVYAAARGDFVLGGLQAVFESDLNDLLESVVDGEHRCALDPGCEKGGGACVACLHVGEPSCRYYNRHLNRGLLWGDKGYLTTEGSK